MQYHNTKKNIEGMWMKRWENCTRDSAVLISSSRFNAAMSNPRAACGPVEGFSLGFRCSKSIPYTTDNLSLFWQF